MDGVELRYRALLGRIYAEKLLAGVDSFVVVYDETPSCIAMAAALFAAAKTARADAVPSGKLAGEVDSAVLVMSPHVAGLGSRAVDVLRKVRRFAALHTPVFYALDEAEGAAEALSGKEVRFAVREQPGEITFYKVSVAGNNLTSEVYDVYKLSPEEAALVRQYEAQHG